MARIRHLLGAAVLIASVGAFAPTSSAEQPERRPAPAQTGPELFKVQLLSFNDFHGHLQPPSGRDETLGAQLDPSLTLVGGAEHLARTLGDRRELVSPTRSLTVAAGDLIGGTPFLSGLFHDEPAIESLDAMGLDVSSVGNHEFDEGIDELHRIQNGGCHPEDGCYFPREPYRGADFSYLAANVFREGTDETVLPATWIKRVNGVDIGFIGMTLEGTPELVAQSGIRGLEFRDEVATANAAAVELHAQDVKSIVVLLHEGGFQSGTFQQCVGPSGPIVDIAKRLSSRIDMVVTGHTHQPYICNIPDRLGRPRMVTSAASFGRVVTDTRITIDASTGNIRRGRVQSSNVLVARDGEKDAEQTRIIAKWDAKSAPIANEVIGSISADITRGPSRAVESALANLIADAQLAATSAPELGGGQVAFMNPGGVRADFTVADISGGEQPGEVTYGEAFEVQPFGNLLVTMNLTGEQIEQLLEQQATPARTLIFGVSDGFTFTYDAAAPVGSRIDPASVQLDGVVLDPTTTYRITTNSFLADGGDGFTVFTEGSDRAGGGEDLQALIDYFEANSPLSPPGDRIAGI